MLPFTVKQQSLNQRLPFLSACTKLGKPAVVYLCVRLINFVPLYDFFIVFGIAPIVVFFVLHITLLKTRKQSTIRSGGIQKRKSKKSKQYNIQQKWSMQINKGRQALQRSTSNTNSIIHPLLNSSRGSIYIYSTGNVFKVLNTN